jgi:hypothetical protein
MLQIEAKCIENMFITSIIHEYGVAKKKALTKQIQRDTLHNPLYDSQYFI